MIQICFVCTGNTCRSIMAERLLKKRLKEKKISDVKVISRGLAADGGNISEEAKKILKENKASAANRKSVKLGKIDAATLYIVMDERMKKYIHSTKIISIKDIIGEDISDPYGYDENVYRKVAQQLTLANQKLIEKIETWRSL